MRTYKFRGKLTDGRTVYHNLEHFRNGRYMKDARVIPATIAQLIGYDKNGDEVYDDDEIYYTDETTIGTETKHPAISALNYWRFGETFTKCLLVKKE